MAVRKATYSFVVARSRNRIIGCENQLPWRLPSDLRAFKEVTIGKPVIMGRRTYESIGRPLPGRANIVISRNNGIDHPEVVVARDKRTAMRLAEDAAVKLGADEVMVIGGEQIFELFEDEVQKVYLTEVDAHVQGDAYFAYDFSEWEELSRKAHSKKGTSDEYDYTFVILRRRPTRTKWPFRASQALEVGG